MHPDAATGHTGHIHLAATHASDEEFLSIVAPFVADGLDADEPAVAVLERRYGALLRKALHRPGLIVLDAASQYVRPASTIRFFRELVSRHVADGARRVRVVGQIPDAGTRVWTPWARYEAALNHVLADQPLWGLCTYDRTTTPAHVLADVERTHPWLLTAEGRHRRNPHYEDPATLSAPAFVHGGDIGGRLGRPTVELIHPSAAEARALAVRLGARAGLATTRTDGLVLAVSETVANARRHGTPPARLRLWQEPGRVTAAVTDGGSGPDDPFAGLVPARSNPAEGGLGLWIVHQVCDLVTMHRHENGFTITAAVVEAHEPGPQP